MDLGYLEMGLRLLAAGILGGLVGAERESENKNAGFRTHMLVCVASALVMITGEFIFEMYKGVANIDPTRLGAQVISGIGFLGAGAIIKEGISVKGLTTAASLWSISCVGLACGAGFYTGAVATTILILVVLLVLKKMENSLIRKAVTLGLMITTVDKPGQIGKITTVMGKYGININGLKIIPLEDVEYINISLLLQGRKAIRKEEIIGEIAQIDGIRNITII